MTTTSLEPVLKQATVPCSPSEAFELFTAQIGAWWPLATHSVGLGDAVAVAIVPLAGGGRIVETARDGRTFEWGTVTSWQPGKRVVFSWHPGHGPDAATTVEVSFEPDAGGDGCVVTLVHSGWERRPDGAGIRLSYVPGWNAVLAPFLRVAGAP